MEIKKLPDAVANILQSGVVITDAAQCVLELLYNALDANATAIAVRTDLKKFYVQVVDNGCGMRYEDLQQLGDRHVTSKCHCVEELEANLPTYGYRGVALASITDICDRLEIQSRCNSSQSTFTVMLKNSAGGSREIYENTRVRPTHGTTVTIVNFMVSLPVRRKRIKDIFDLDFIMQQIEALATIHHSVSFSLRNDTTGKVLLQTHRREAIQQVLIDNFSLAVEKNLIPVTLKQGHIEVTGFVSRHLHTDCSIQFIYVNNRVIHNDKMHKLIMDLLSKYADIWKRDRVNPEEVVDVDGFIYVLKIQCPYINFSMSRSGRKSIVEFRNSDDVMKCIIRAIKRRFKLDANQSNISVYFDKPAEIKSNAKPSFGPSQMNNVVYGKHATRPKHIFEDGAKSTEASSKIIPECCNLSNNYLATPTCSVLQQYQRKFFNENSKDGSILPDRVPLYEMTDFSEIPFHDFLAWLSLKAKFDNNALQLLSELTAGTGIDKTIAKPIISLKTIRKEKLAARSRLMLRKIKDGQFTITQKRQVEDKENLPPTMINSVRKTAYFSQNFSRFPQAIENKRSLEFPQATFNEFISWLKVKTTHSRTVDIFVNEYLSGKRLYNYYQPAPPPVSVKELRKDKLLRLNNHFLATLKRNKIEKKPIEPIKPSKRLLPQENNMVKKHRRCRENTPEKTTIQNLDEDNNSILLTWKSHYRTDSIKPNKSNPRNTPVFTENNFNSACEKFSDVSMEFQNDVARRSVSIYCEDILPDSPIDSINEAEGVGLEIVQLDPKSKLLLIDKALSPIHLRVDKAIQTDIEVANVSIQASEVGISSSTQTERTTAADKEVQTTGLETLPKEMNCGELSDKVANTCSSESALPEALRPSTVDSSSLILRHSLPDTVPANSGWEEKNDPEGRKYFVHSSSGFSIFDPPACSTRSSFHISNSSKNKNLSKNFDQVQEVVTDSCQDDLSDVKWQDGNKDDVIEPILRILQDAEEDASPESNIVSAKIPKEQINGHKLLSSIAFSKEHLKTAKVIGQLDRKFIVALLPKDDCNGKMVCLFDQHGVDERGTLEILLKKYQTDGKCESESLKSPITMSVSLNTYNMFLSEQTQYNKHGLYGSALDKSSITINAVPACFIRQQEREMKAYRKSSLMHKVSELIEEITEHLAQTRGAGLTMPKTTLAVIASEACRSAIKFNHVLSVEEMSKMIDRLSDCSLPFQCAHGRPSMAPIFELGGTHFADASSKLNYKKIKPRKAQK